MKRILVLLPATIVVALILAVPAAAKPGHEGPIEATATIEGGGLRVPIVLQRGGSGDDECGILYPCSNLRDLDDPFVQLAMYTGLTGTTPTYSASYSEAPAISSRGPAYQLTYRIRLGDRKEVVRQVLYPYVNGQVWVYTPEGQSVFDRPLRGTWLPGAVSLTTLLLDLGLPKDAPVAAPLSRGARPVPVGMSPWVVAFLLLGLLLVAGAALGRSRRTPALGG
jgi:hypothetical protein